MEGRVPESVKDRTSGSPSLKGVPKGMPKGKPKGIPKGISKGIDRGMEIPPAPLGRVSP
jgi:hypothetical protein